MDFREIEQAVTAGDLINLTDRSQMASFVREDTPIGSGFEQARGRAVVIVLDADDHVLGLLPPGESTKAWADRPFRDIEALLIQPGLIPGSMRLEPLCDSLVHSLAVPEWWQIVMDEDAFNKSLRDATGRDAPVSRSEIAGILRPTDLLHRICSRYPTEQAVNLRANILGSGLFGSPINPESEEVNLCYRCIDPATHQEHCVKLSAAEFDRRGNPVCPDHNRRLQFGKC